MKPLGNEDFELLHKQYENLKLLVENEDIGSELQPTWANSDTKHFFHAVIEDLIETLSKLEQSDVNYTRIKAMIGCLYYQESKILVDLDEKEEALQILKKCMDLLKEHILSPEVTFINLKVLNHQCYLLIKNDELDHAQELLEFGEQMYKELKLNGDLRLRNMFSNDDLFAPFVNVSPKNDVLLKFEKLVTNNLQMLGYVYNKQEDMECFSVYHHEVLKRQLDMRDGDATLWAMKTARLGYFFLTRSKFLQARHHLAAACYVLSQYENTLKTLESNDAVTIKWEELNHHYADIAKCWIKYGLYLFINSKARLLSNMEDPDTPDSKIWSRLAGDYLINTNDEPDPWTEYTDKEDINITSEQSTFKPDVNTTANGASTSSSTIEKIFDVIFENDNTSDVSLPTSQHSETDDKRLEDSLRNAQDEPLLVFPNLDLSCFEQCVSCEYVTDIQAARSLFLFTHSWLKKSRQFYTLKDQPMDYISVILDLCELYKYLAFFENDVENQYIIHKRRENNLETLRVVIKVVKPPCYFSTHIELLKELAEVQLELMSLNLKRIYLSQSECNSQSQSKPEQSSERAIPTFLPVEGEHLIHKMEAVADLHLQLEQFGEYLTKEHLDYWNDHSSTGRETDPRPGPSHEDKII